MSIARLLGSLLRFIFDLTGSYGLSIIVFTIVIKLVMVPLTIKQTRAMKKIQELQPKMDALKAKYKNDQEQLNIKLMELYKEHNVNPLGGCLPLLIQLPILFALFAVLRNPVEYVFQSEALYESVNTSFLWLTNLSNPDPWILPIFAAVTTYLSSLTMPSQNKNEPSQKMMMYFFPIMILWWGRSFPAGLTLYWVVSNLFQIGQQLIIVKPYAKLKEGSE